MAYDVRATEGSLAPLVHERRPSTHEALDAFLLDLALEGRSAATIRTYRSLLKLPDGPIDGLTPEVCRRLVGERLKQSRATARTFSDALASFTRYLAALYGVPDAMREVPKPRVKPPPHRFLTKDQLRAVWAACPDDAYRRLVLLLMEGLRASEAVGLRWRDVQGDTATVRGKGGRYRRIVLSHALTALLADIPNPENSVLGFEYRELHRRVVWLGKAARLPFRLKPHLLRHTWASQSILAGMDSETLRTLGGWSPTSTIIDRYIRSAREEAALERSRELGLTDRLFQDLETTD